MSDKDRKKKHGERKDKKRERMRKTVQERQARAGAPRPSGDQADLVRYKPGSPLDRNWQREQSAEPPGRATKTTRPVARGRG
jgi:hypothetical protein